MREFSNSITIGGAYGNYCDVVIHCPLSDDGERISKLISYLAFLDR
jgi:hypothetical protein